MKLKLNQPKKNAALTLNSFPRLKIRTATTKINIQNYEKIILPSNIYFY